ncbi:insulin-like 3 (Leydig cell) [Pangasianodon hypophthalmus]|uniref:insulin-like 3 (Leydig cell) n=1 Tax=Pangasianodon hypophthalmus TaxID=310915 RepID=UPI000F00AC45|nr:insulin-like 3 (Leydig cell) [Pangasianodon hypophthalmus]
MNIKWIITLTVLLIAENDGISGKDVRVKLCGREFIRMVVTLCGSSRLRRYAPEINPMSISPHEIKSSSEDQTINNSPENSSLSSFLKIMESLEHSSSRLQRDIGPAGVCCRSGCTKTELVQYC